MHKAFCCQRLKILNARMHVMEVQSWQGFTELRTCREVGSLSPWPQRSSSAKAATAKACMVAGCMKRLPCRRHSPLRARAELCCLPPDQQV